MCCQFYYSIRIAGYNRQKCFFRKNHKKHLTRVQNYADDETIRQGGEKAGMEIVLDVIQVVLAAILVVLVYKLYKKQ